MPEDEWDAIRGGVLVRKPWGGTWVMHQALTDNLSLHSPPPRPGDGADGDRRTNSRSASSTETRNHGCRPSRGARNPVGTRNLESPPARTERNRHPSPAKAQQADPSPEDRVYEAAIPLRAQAQRCVEICRATLDQFNTQTKGLGDYIDADMAASIWELKLRKLGQRNQDKNKSVNLQVMSLQGCIQCMEVAANGLQRQIAASGGDEHDPCLAALMPIREHTKALGALSAVVGSSNTQCEVFIKKLQDLIDLLETEKEGNPFALFRFGRPGSPEHDGRVGSQQQQNYQQRKDGQQDECNITENQNGKNRGGNKSREPPENNQHSQKEEVTKDQEVAEKKQAAEAEHLPEGEQTEGAEDGLSAHDFPPNC